MGSTFCGWCKRGIILFTLVSALQISMAHTFAYAPHTTPRIIRPEASTPANEQPTPCTTAVSTNIMAHTSVQGASVPLWLAGTIGLISMISGGMLVYIALPRPGNPPHGSDNIEDESVNRDENASST